MITNKELSEVSLSPTKKDYYQIWNELIELADKISERWSPASTNESDPGIVLLKALTAVADKLNYNIDKNTLEAFMPSATQEESMRKLTEMMGYDMKHYYSATGKATITYKSSTDTPIESILDGIYFPKFINLKNEDEDINYITLEDFTLQANQDSREVSIIEGELLECETNNDNIVTLLQLDDLNRYILPEYAIAENGIFITNIKDSKESNFWRREQNLNVQQPGAQVYKVGFDSTLQLPYIQFPADIKTLIEDGLRIRYIRTNGLNGNISARVLSKLEKPAIWSTAENELIKNLTKDDFVISNASATFNGADPESLDSAYNNYKKTIGTFDTLVTCRDYMNKIYQMTESDTDSTPLVSNIIVSDIRDDINRSIPICTFNEYGICYKDASLVEPIILSLPAEPSGALTSVRYTKNKIEHFDLIMYPFKPTYGLNTKMEYKNSFQYTAENLQKIQADLALNKTIAHKIIQPVVGSDADSDIACIKNYLQLRARISTTKKVTLIEEAEILNNVYKAIYKNFNARQVEFGEEIPYDTLVSTIEQADYRIREVNLDEPTLTTKLCFLNNIEKPIAEAPEAYNKLALRNVLAGRISAFKYNDEFLSTFDQITYPPVTDPADRSATLTYNLNYPRANYKITSITSEFDVGAAFSTLEESKKSEGLTLRQNEVIQFRLPNFRTLKTYPAYVNYYIKLNMTKDGGINAIPATFQTLNQYLGENIDPSTTRWMSFLNSEAYNAANPGPINAAIQLVDGGTAGAGKITSEDTYRTLKANYGAVFTLNGTNTKWIEVTSFNAGTDTTKNFYYFPVTDNTFYLINNWIKNQDGNHGAKLTGLYRTSGIQEKPYGKLIDVSQKKYWPAYSIGSVVNNAEALSKMFVQVTREEASAEATADGLGQDASYEGIPKNGEYQLQSGEFLLINYTESKTDDSGQETKSTINLEYTAGTIIRANFDLIDSDLYNVNHTFSKRDKFNFENHPTIQGLFTLGTNEQIEIRQVVQINLDEPSTYLYWTLNSDNPEASKNEFIFTEDYGLDEHRCDSKHNQWGTASNPVHNAYTLKEGEHLYYTNHKKQDLVYYGAGTLIVRNPDTPDLIKYTINGEVSEEDVVTNGLAANIPWQPFDLNSTQRRLEIVENQYISLTEGDSIISIDNTDPAEGLTNTWRPVESSAKYRFAEDDVASTLPKVAVKGFKWAVRSRLDFNMSKDLAQPLHYGDKLTITQTHTTDASQKETIQIKPGLVEGQIIPLYLNSNYTCQAATDTVNISDSNVDLKLKLTKKASPRIAEGLNMSFNNYVNGDTKYTKFDFENLPKSYTATTAAFSLNISIPSSEFGLLMIYYIDDPDSRAVAGYNPAKIRANTPGIAFFNKANSSNVSELNLTPGMNIIKLTNTATNLTSLSFYPDSAQTSTVVFSGLDIVSGINPKLDYKVIDAATSLEQLLNDIKALKVAEDFYYNVPVQRSTEIDLNNYLVDDLLSSPATWYDINNVNRKFVISEVDADYLTTGITLTKASRV